MSAPSVAIALCLQQLQDGDVSAVARLLPLIYDDLRALARRIQGRRAHSLNPTALVHEAYGRLVGAGAKGYAGRRHFFQVAAMAMRQLLADHAREQRRLKRGGGAERITLRTEDAVHADADAGVDLIALDDALTELARRYPRQARVVELRFLAGLGVDETAEALGVSPRTVKLDWQLARGWLSRALSGGQG